MKKTAYFLFAIAICFVTSLTASAQTITLVDLANDAQDFTFLAYDTATLTPSADGIVIDVAPGAVDNFGGLGFGVGSLDNAPNLGLATSILVNVRQDAGNLADLVFTLREDNGNPAVLGEFFSYTIPQSSLGPVGTFTTIAVSPTSFGFNGDPDNATLDLPLYEVGIQSPFGQNNQQNVTVRSISIAVPEVIPEPSSLALLLSIGSVVAVRRRRA